MAYQLFIGLIAEGATDQAFMQNVIERTFAAIQFECEIDIEVYAVKKIDKKVGKSFVKTIIDAAETAHNEGITVLCIHTDADGRSIQDTMLHKIAPIQTEIQLLSDEFSCKVIVPLIPIQETEAWMLADTALLKYEIGTIKSDQQLGIHRSPETIANPKEAIENAIRIARADLAKKRRRDLTIGDLYQPIGQAIDLKKLETLASYQHFQENVRNVFRALNFL